MPVAARAARLQGMEGFSSLLVAYATKRASTQEVAASIAAELRDRGHRVDLRPAADIRVLDGYDGVVLGGSLYVGRWHPDAVAFLRRHRADLATVPLAVFALGPRTLEEADVAASRAQLEAALRKVPEVSSSEVAVFGGVSTRRSAAFR